MAVSRAPRRVSNSACEPIPHPTGECEVIGAKVGGIAVHIGARVAALAHPGEVLVSNTVKDLVAGSGLSFQERGVHTLKGVPGEWRLYALREARVGAAT